MDLERRAMSDQRLDFSDEQEALISSEGSVFVEACPGAGKTQTIVQRFIERPHAEDARRGVALLSFTNAAAEEARSRCAVVPHLARAPNFIGTIDAFMNRFIVGPLFVSRHGIAPQFCDSWANVPRTEVQVGARRVPLDWFALDLSGTAVLDDLRVPHAQRHQVRSLEQWQRRRAEAAAGGLWGRLLSAGVLNSEAVRLKVDKYLGDPAVRERHQELLAARFAEVIVDEVQDCAPADVRLLEFLAEAGIRLVLVGDPDQAIYGFRGARYEHTAALTSRVPLGARLAGNHRSSPAICKIVDSLRSSAQRDRPVGRNAQVEAPVQVLAYRDPQDIRARAMQIIEELGISEEQVMVLAHSGSLSQRSAGVVGTSTSSTSRLVHLAYAFRDLQTIDASARLRARALQTVQVVVRELSQEPAGQTVSETAFLQQQKLTLRTFREGCLRLALGVADPFSGPPSVFLAELRAREWAKTELGWDPSRLRRPQNDRWPSRPGSVGVGLPNSTIHGFKGLQRPAVVLVIPKATREFPNGVDAWEAGDASEERRVLYVGASRAEVLLVLAVHEDVRDQVVRILQRDAVPYESHELPTEGASPAEEPVLA